MSASEKYWQAFEARMEYLLRSVFTAAGLPWGVEYSEKLNAAVSNLRAALAEDINDGFAAHLDNAPHLYPDGSS